MIIDGGSRSWQGRGSDNQMPPALVHAEVAVGDDKYDM